MVDFQSLGNLSNFVRNLNVPELDFYSENFASKNMISCYHWSCNLINVTVSKLRWEKPRYK